MDWFERLTGFKETDPFTVRQNMAMEGERLVSRANGSNWGAGRLETSMLRELRTRRVVRSGSTTFCLAQGDVGAAHADPANAGAFFQVASQFNALEMVSPSITPEQGVTRYERDHTQGPGCAMAAGAATIYRNYFVPLEGGVGQSGARQIDGSADLRACLSAALGIPPQELWEMENGYLLIGRGALDKVSSHIASASEAERDALRGTLAVTLHYDVEVTQVGAGRGQRVSQAFCSALPIAYNDHPVEAWEPFARLVLEAAYEATLRAAATQGNGCVFLTSLGGGAFGNPKPWIYDAIDRALNLCAYDGLDVRHLSFSAPDEALVALANKRQR